MTHLRLSERALNWALTSVERDADTDVFPPLPEYQAIRTDWHAVRAELLKIDITNYTANAPIRALTPKRRYGFRISTQLDPLDHLYYTALVYEAAIHLEEARSPKEQQIVHSYRWKPSSDGRMFDPDFDWHSFVARSLQLAIPPAQYVVVTDISDFYQRLYLHRIERIVDILGAAGKENHGRAIARLIKQWNNGQSYGLPIGQSASRVVAEAVIADIDELLSTKGIAYARFNDDFHLFCKSKSEAYDSLAYLAQILFDTHGLTLQESKTSIVSCSEFQARAGKSDSDAELDNFSANLAELLEHIGVDSWYELPDLSELDEDQKNELRLLNLEMILKRQMPKPNPDTRQVRWAINRLSRVRDPGAAQTVVRHLESCQHLIPEMAKYFVSIGEKLDRKVKDEVSKKLLDHIDSGKGAFLPFHRAWLLYVFRRGALPGDADRIAGFADKFNDELTRRESMLTLGVLRKDSWFRSQKSSSATLGVWLRRAFLEGAYCLPEDERSAFYKARKRNADLVEKAIMKAR